MLNRCIFWILTVFCVFFAHTVRAETIGTILEIEGTVTVAHPGEAAHTANIKDEISMHDTISTGAGSKAFILLIDDTEWTLSENAKFEVTDYEFNPDNNADNQARYSVLQGAFRYVSGLVAKRPEPDVNISTPAASIGIRGTDFSGGMDEDGEYGIYVDEGSVNVQNESGAALLKQGQGTSMRGRNTAPRAAGAWHKEKVERMHGRMFLKYKERIQQRRQQLGPRQKEQLEKFKAGRQQRLEQRKQRLQNLKENRHENREERKGEIQEKLQQRKEKLGNLKDRAQDNAETRRQKIEKYKENHPGQGQASDSGDEGQQHPLKNRLQKFRRRE